MLCQALHASHRLIFVATPCDKYCYYSHFWDGGNETMSVNNLLPYMEEPGFNPNTWWVFFMPFANPILNLLCVFLEAGSSQTRSCLRITWILEFWNRAQESAFLTSSQVTLMLLLPDLEALWEPQGQSPPKSGVLSSLSSCLLFVQRLRRCKMLPECKALCFRAWSEPNKFHFMSEQNRYTIITHTHE